MTAIDTNVINTPITNTPIINYSSNEINEFGDLTLSGVDWSVAAACRAVESAGTLFFSDEFADIRAAKLICAECPVMAQCLEEAFDRSEPCGVWGGQLFEDGKILTVKRRRGRPPKNPRPEDQLPMVPIPEHLVELVA